MDFLLPSALLAERMVIGGCLLDGARNFPIANGILDPADFSIEKHRVIWRTSTELWESGVIVDRVTVAQRLNETNRLTEVDGLNYLISLDDGIPQVINIEPYCDTVRRYAERRRFIERLSGLVTCAAMDESEDLHSLIERTRTALSDIQPDRKQEFQTPGDVIIAAGGLDAYLSAYQGTAIPWPWAFLDDATGGMYPGDLIIMAAPPGRGKTWFAANVALRAAECCGVAVFSHEMSRAQVINRLAARSGQFNLAWLKHSLSDHQRGRVSEGFSAVSDLPVYVSDRACSTLAATESAVRRLLVGRKIGLIVVDYLQLMTATGRSSVEQIAAISRGLKTMALSLSILVLALSQLSREQQRDEREPQLYDLKGSGGIESDANVVLFLHGTFKYAASPREELEVKFILAKNRDGIGGRTWPMLFRGDCGIFREAT